MSLDYFENLQLVIMILYYKSALGKDFKLSIQKNHWLENIFDIMIHFCIYSKLSADVVTYDSREQFMKVSKFFSTSTFGKSGCSTKVGNGTQFLSK